jgi:hypothetical protein
MFRLLVLVCAKVHILSDLAKKKARKVSKKVCKGAEGQNGWKP